MIIMGSIIHSLEFSKFAFPLSEFASFLAILLKSTDEQSVDQ